MNRTKRAWELIDNLSRIFQNTADPIGQKCEKNTQMFWQCVHIRSDTLCICFWWRHESVHVVKNACIFHEIRRQIKLETKYKWTVGFRSWRCNGNSKVSHRLHHVHAHDTENWSTVSFRLLVCGNDKLVMPYQCSAKGSLTKTSSFSNHIVLAWPRRVPWKHGAKGWHTRGENNILHAHGNK